VFLYVAVLWCSTITSLLEVCERLSAGWTSIEVVQLLGHWMDKQGRARAPTKPQANNKTLRHNITSDVTTEEHGVNFEEQSSLFSSWFVTIHITSDITNKKGGRQRTIAILQFSITKSVK
jgi:hypothetical protein